MDVVSTCEEGAPTACQHVRRVHPKRDDPKPTLVPSALICSSLANLFRKHVARLQDNKKQAESMAFHGTCVQQSLP